MHKLPNSTQSFILPSSLAVALILPLTAASLITNGDFSGGTGGTFAPGSSTTGNSVPAGWTGFATGTGALGATGSEVQFNGNNQPTGNYVEQNVSTAANRWYVLDWSQRANAVSANASAGVTSSFWNGASTGAADFNYTARWVGPRQSLFRTSGLSTTVRLSDVGSITNSADTYLDNVAMDLADGQMNVSSLATVSASSAFGGNWGRVNNAIDGGVAGSDSTVFHSNVSGGGDWYQLDFSANLPGAFLSRIEIEARPGLNNRMGNTLDIYSSTNALIASLLIDDSSGTFSIDGSWSDVGRIRITDTNNYLNLAEVRAFSNFMDGVMVPEPSSTALFSLSALVLILRRRR